MAGPYRLRFGVLGGQSRGGQRDVVGGLYLCQGCASSTAFPELTSLRLFGQRCYAIPALAFVLFGPK